MRVKKCGRDEDGEEGWEIKGMRGDRFLISGIPIAVDIDANY